MSFKTFAILFFCPKNNRAPRSFACLLLCEIHISSLRQKKICSSTALSPFNLRFICGNSWRAIVPHSCRHPFNSRLICGNSWRAIVPHSCRHPFNLRLICGNSWRAIVPPSSPLSYHFRRTFHTTFVLSKIYNRLSTKQFHNFPEFHIFQNISGFSKSSSVPSIPSRTTRGSPFGNYNA